MQALKEPCLHVYFYSLPGIIFISCWLCRKKKDVADKETAGESGDDSHDASVLDKTTTQADVTQQPNKDSSSSILDISKYRAFLRELDMDVFDMLGVGLITKAALDTDMNTKV